ncbi:MAG TPA: hypothetical protein VM097_01255 [Mycobacteriales bacterium]|nr:hypothetical protein [Mycobacteriales bacterium]
MSRVANALSRAGAGITRKLESLPFGPWTLSEDEWSRVWKDGVTLRFFLGTLVLGLGGVVSLLSLDLGTAALGLLLLVGAAGFWRLTTNEVQKDIEWENEQD